MVSRASLSSFFFFNDTATTEIYTLSLHDALPISIKLSSPGPVLFRQKRIGQYGVPFTCLKFRTMNAVNDSQIHKEYVDRKSTRLNSSHDQISYAVFCLKKKKQHRRKGHGVDHTIS